MGHEVAYDETDKLIDELCGWMAEMGTDLRAGSRLRLVKSRRAEEGRCVLATADIEFNAELVRIPSSFILNFRFVLEDASLVRFVEWAVAKLSARNHAYRLVRLDAIYLYLIVQRLRPGARLAKFVDSMPQSYDTPEYFDARLVAVLPSCLRSDCQKRIDRLRDKYTLFRGLLDEYTALNNGDSDSQSSPRLLAKHLDLELLRWAFCAVNSRCFHIEEADICSAEELSIGDRLFGSLSLPEAAPDGLATLDEYYALKEREEVVRNNLCCMIPYLDFLNHSFKSNSCGYYDKEAGAFVLRAIDLAESSDEALLFEPEPRYAIQTGQQVYITYGHHDNKTLLLEYGFIIEENSNDRLDVTPADLAALLAPSVDERARFESTLIAENYLSDLSCNKFTGPSWYLLKALNLACELNEPASDQDHHDNQLQLQRQQRKKKKKKKLKAQHTDDIGAENVDKIGQLFERLLSSYRDDLKASLANLANLTDASISPYHVEMTRKFCLQYLEIVEFNISLVQDSAKWRELF